jgi:hypothetical protein
MKLRNGVAVLVGSLCALAQAQSLDADLLKQYGGWYSVDCKDKAADAAVISAHEISVFRGSQQVIAKKPEPFYSSYGKNPPKGFEVTVAAELTKEVGLFFDVYRVRGNQYILIHGHPDAMKRLARSDEDAKFFLCKKFGG